METDEKYLRYYDILKEHNSMYNLTSVEGFEQTKVRHFEDSLKADDYLNGGDILDIGSGAGFPAIPLAINNPDKKFTLIESVRKKADFLKLLNIELNLQNVEILNLRIEDYKNREYFSTVVMRAVAPLRSALEYAVPFLKTGGIFIAFKGKKAEEEIKEAQNALKILNARVKQIIPYALGGEAEKTLNLLIIEKYNKTDKKYPRQGNKARLQPL